MKFVRIWGIMHGPFHIDEMPVDDVPSEVYEYGVEWMAVTKVETDTGELLEVNQWFDSFNQVYELKNYFDRNIEPIEVDDEGNLLFEE